MLISRLEYTIHQEQRLLTNQKIFGGHFSPKPCKMMAGYSLKENQYKVLKIHRLQKNKESKKRGITLISRSKNKVHQVL